MQFGGEIFVWNIVQALKGIPNSPSTVGYNKHRAKTVKIPCTTVEICTFPVQLGRNHSIRCGVVLWLYNSQWLDVLAPAAMYSRVRIDTFTCFLTSTVLKKLDIGVKQSVEQHQQERRHFTPQTTVASCSCNDVYICFSTMESSFTTNEICGNIIALHR